MTLSDDATRFNWMLDDFVQRVDGVTDAVAVSADGLLMAASATLDRAGAEQVSAIISGLVSLGHGTAACFGFGGLDQVMVAMSGGYLFVSSISDGSCLGVVASRRGDVGQIGFEARRLVEQAGRVLTPELISELRHELLVSP